MIPKYAFQVVVYRANGTQQLHTQTKNFESLGVATTYALAEARNPTVRRIDTLMVMDEGHRPIERWPSGGQR